MKRFEILVKGKVQGVGFRFFATSKATTFGITGFCKNLSDGDVYIEAQGDFDKLNKFIDNLKEGNRFIKVSEVISKELPLKEGEKKFKMEY